jgi:hypothetical protein
LPPLFFNLNTTSNDFFFQHKLQIKLQIVGDVPEAVRTPEEVHHLAEFFTARLKDW